LYNLNDLTVSFFGGFMKNLSKAALVASTVLASSALFAVDNSVISGFGENWKDGQGDCVVAPGASAKGCEVAPAPAPVPQAVTHTIGAGSCFATGNANLSAQGHAELANLAAKARGAVAVEVVGHTDSVGREAYNQDLSERRAVAVADYLVSQGIAPNIISVRGVGENSPVASNGTRDGRQQNRRVDVTIVTQTIK
jgi:outer membrane protein OmpA-like peptidoglycan-associated protein